MRRRLKRYVSAALLLGLFALAGWWLRKQTGSFGEALLLLHDALAPYPWLLLLVFALRPFVLFPVSLTVISCGVLIDGPAAYLVGWIGEWISALTGYAVLRWLLGEQDEEPGDFVARWQARLQERAFETVLLMRVLLLPYDLVNYGCAWLRTPALPYALATLVGIIPANIALVTIGASVDLEVLAGDPAKLTLTSLLDLRQLLFSGILLLSVLGIAHLLHRRRPRARR